MITTELYALYFTDRDRQAVAAYRAEALALGGDVVIYESDSGDLPEACWITEPGSPFASADWVCCRRGDGMIYANHLRSGHVECVIDITAFLEVLICEWEAAVGTRSEEWRFFNPVGAACPTHPHLRPLEPF